MPSKGFSLQQHTAFILKNTKWLNAIQPQNDTSVFPKQHDASHQQAKCTLGLGKKN